MVTPLQVAGARHLDAQHEVVQVRPVLHRLADRCAVHQHLLGHLGDHQAASVLVPAGLPLVGALALDGAVLVLPDVVVHVAQVHAPVAHLLQVQPGHVHPPCTCLIHTLHVGAGYAHRDAVGVDLHQRQAADLHQALGQQAQQQLPVERDRHGEQRVVEHAELVVAVAVHAVERELQHGALAALLGVLLALLEQIAVDRHEVLAQVRRVELVGDGQVRVVAGDVEVDDDVLVVRLHHHVLQRAVDAAQAEDEREPVDRGREIREDALGLGDRLRLEPVQHPDELGLLERDPQQDGVLQVDHRARGLPRRASIGAEVVAGDAGLLQAQREVLLADLGVVEVQPVLARVLDREVFAEPQHVRGQVVEEPRGLDIVLVVALEHVHLVMGQRGADLEGQVLDGVHAQVELQRLEAGGAGLVVEVVDLVEVDLLHDAVAGLDRVQPAVVIVLALDDGLRLAVQRLRVRLTHLHQGVQDGVVEADVVEACHAGVAISEVAHELDNLPGLVAPLADLEHQLDGCLDVHHRQREDVGERLAVVHPIVHADTSQLLLPSAHEMQGTTSGSSSVVA